MSKKKKQQLVSHEVISAAILKFRMSGGMIGKLPEQRYERRAVVGEDKHHSYESLSAFASLG